MTVPHAGQIVVIAKAPVPGRVKTRLSPPCSPEQAARLAAAALADTLAAVRAAPVRRRVIAFDGDPLLADLGGFDVLEQRGAGLGPRLANAFVDAATGPGAGLPTLLVGMDTPQLTVDLLIHALDVVSSADAALGHAPDGGWWGLALTDPAAAAVLADVPMSEGDTGALTELALRRQGIRLALLPELPDVDTFDDALAVARQAPDSRFARELATITNGASL
ncbi:MAG: TIGR04282 family arsenosugar biosynthesis glycosyltransferase [Geodermatophilaceae bacterium]